MGLNKKQLLQVSRFRPHSCQGRQYECSCLCTLGTLLSQAFRNSWQKKPEQQMLDSLLVRRPLSSNALLGQAPQRLLFLCVGLEWEWISIAWTQPTHAAQIRLGCLKSATLKMCENPFKEDSSCRKTPFTHCCSLSHLAHAFEAMASCSREILAER